MPYCVKCGAQIDEGAATCPKCGEPVAKAQPQQTQYAGLADILQRSVGIAVKNPLLFVPELVGALVSFVGYWAMGEYLKQTDILDLLEDFRRSTGQVSTVAYDYSKFASLMPYVITILLVFIVLSGFSGLCTLALFRMIRDVYSDQKPDLGSAGRFVASRVIYFFLFTLLGNLLSLTIILVPAILFCYVSIAGEGVGIREGLSRGFRFSMNNIGGSVALVVLYFVAQTVVGYVPRFDKLVFVIPGTILEVAFFYYYSVRMNPRPAAPPPQAPPASPAPPADGNVN